MESGVGGNYQDEGNGSGDEVASNDEQNQSENEGAGGPV